MNEAEARTILHLDGDGAACGIQGRAEYVLCFVKTGEICLDGTFTTKELDAISFWMKRRKGEE